MANTTSPQSSDVTDAEMFELLEKVNEQYRVYKELHDVVNIARKPASSIPTPSPENPLTSNGLSLNRAK